MCTHSPPTPTHTHAHTYTPTPTQTHILSYRDSSYTPTLWGLQHKRTKHSSHLLMCYTHFETRNFYIYSFSWGSTNSINTMVVRHLILKFPIFFRMLHILRISVLREQSVFIYGMYQVRKNVWLQVFLSSFVQL